MDKEKRQLLQETIDQLKGIKEMKSEERQLIQEIIEKLEGLEASLRKQVSNESKGPGMKMTCAIELGGVTAARRALETVT